MCACGSKSEELFPQRSSYCPGREGEKLIKKSGKEETEKQRQREGQRGVKIERDETVERGG